MCAILCAAAALLIGSPRPGQARLRSSPSAAGARRRSRQGWLEARRRRADACAAVPVFLVVDLVAAAVDAGTAPAAACLAVADAVRSSAAPPVPGSADHVRDPEADMHDLDLAADLQRIACGSSVCGPDLVEFAGVLSRAERWGVAPGAMIRRCAEEERRRSAATAEAAINRLPIRLVLPAGVCLLPAALLLGVVPVVLDLLPRVLR